MPYPRASLLGLPTELRFMIYDIVKDSDISHQIPIEWGRPPHPSPRLPLGGLARSCKFLAHDVLDHRSSLSANEGHAATITIRVGPDGNHDAWLSHESCPARDLKVLNIVCDIPISSRRHYGSCAATAYRVINLNLMVFPAFYQLLRPAELEVQVFCQVWVDRSDLPSEEQYLREVEDIREKLKLLK